MSERRLRIRAIRLPWRWAIALGAVLCASGCSDSHHGATRVTPSPPATATLTVTPTATATVPPASPLVDVAATLEPDGTALLVSPVTALRGRTTYGLVLTRGITDSAGNSLQADDYFKSLEGTNETATEGPVALFDADPESPRNPYPEARLVHADGSVHVPDHFAFRGLPDEPALAAARQYLRRLADDLEGVHGFSTTAPARIALSAPIDLASVNPTTLLLFERDDGQLDLEGLLGQAARRGVAREDVALAISFPTQPIEDDLRAIRTQLIARANGGHFQIILDDPDPSDDLPIGLFHHGDAEFPEDLADNASVGAVAVGLIRSPDFRGAGGVFDPEKVSGAVPAEEALIDFILVLPTGGAVPPRVVILQHGFGGSNLSMLPLAGDLARQGLASIAISAVSHGRRGSPLALLRSRAIQVRDIFRQTIADQMALVRALEAGVDVDGDGRADVDTSEIDYLGRSLGSILGATFVAVEGRIHAAVLNVGGGRVAFLGQAPAVRPIYSGYYAGITDLDLDSPEFDVFVDRLLELGQQSLDSADPLNFARFWTIAPFPGAPAHRILLQEGIGDEWVTNENTEALALAGGLSANEPVEDPDGVSGLWRFDPPGGHGILDRPDVRDQAVSFLVSGGTAISEPEPSDQ